MGARLHVVVAMPPADHVRILVDAGRAFAAAYLIAMMFAMGVALGGEGARAPSEKRRARRLVVRALALNLVLLPLLAFALTASFDASGEVAMAFLLLAASPGGRFAPHLSKIARAELGLSVELTLFLAKLVCFTAPVTARWMLHTRRLELHDLTFIAQLMILQLLPYVLGRQLKKRRPLLAARMARPLELVSWCCVVPVLVVALALRPLHAVVSLGAARGWWAVLVFAVAAPVLGWLVGGPAREARRAFAVSANARNLGLALVLASVGFADATLHVAIFVVWLALGLVDWGYAMLAGVRPRGAVPQPA